MKNAGPQKGRGAFSNPQPRFNRLSREDVEDEGFGSFGVRVATKVTEETARTIISRNRSPDIPFDQSINAYRGCEHGCIYCYARPSHAYMGLSPGLDFETRLFSKHNAPELLQQELGKHGYVCKPIALGANTDPYQPIERDHRITRKILEVLWACRHPVTITTKSALIERDIDLLSAMAQQQLVQVQISLTTLDCRLARLLEPRASTTARRLSTVSCLSQAGVPVTALIAPVIPFLTDHELEDLVQQAAAAGACHANYILLRLPLELKGLFSDWLEGHYPEKRQHVLSRLSDMHGGKLYDPVFAQRQTGRGLFAEMLQQRFRLAIKRNRLAQTVPLLDCAQFLPPQRDPSQLSLF